MLRFRELTTETAGLLQPVGSTTTPAPLFSIPARRKRRPPGRLHYAKLVAEHRLEEDEAAEVAYDLAYRLAGAPSCEPASPLPRSPACRPRSAVRPMIAPR